MTLFAMKINFLATIIPSDVFSSMFVDDVLISASDYQDVVEKKLQYIIDKISEWAEFNGFLFLSKTTMMEFYEKCEEMRVYGKGSDCEI